MNTGLISPRSIPTTSVSIGSTEQRREVYSASSREGSTFARRAQSHERKNICLASGACVVTASATYLAIFPVKQK